MKLSVTSLTLASFPLTTSIRWWLHFALWVVFGFGTLSGIITVVRERVKGKLLNVNGNVPATTPAPALPTGWPLAWRRMLLVITGEKATRQANKALFWAMGFLMGVTFTLAWESQHLNPPEHDLRVVAANSPTFLFQPENRFYEPLGNPYAHTFCPDLVPSFQVGNFVKILRTRREPTCESLTGKEPGFIVERDTELQPVIYIPEYLKTRRVAWQTGTNPPEGP